MNQHTRLWAGLAALALAAGCRAPVAPERPAETGLAPSEGLDWSSRQLTSPAIAEAQARQVKRALLAYPDASPAWAGGLAGAALGLSSTDTVPNGAAVAYPIANPALANQLFFLSREGKLVRLNRLNPANHRVLDLGHTFSHTAVSLSPHCTRAYLLADDGAFFIVDTVTMAVVATRTYGGGTGLCPAVDHGASAPLDRHDVVYVPTSDGYVHRLVVEPGASAGTVALSGETRYDVATTVQATGAKLAAPAVVHRGVIYAGDEAGNFHVVDTANRANDTVYYLGAPVHTAPSLALQDGSYTVTDPAGNPKYVPYGQPVYAFVSAGASCAWINLHDATVTYSRPLRIDDADPTRRYGYLLDYAFANTGTTVTLAAVDGANLETGGRPLPGYEPAARSADYLVPAETNSYELNGEAQGGPIVSYLRWRSDQVPEGGLVTKATLTLTAAFDQACRVPRVRATSPYFLNSLMPWRSDALDPSNRPAIGASGVGGYLSGGQKRPYGNVTFRHGKAYQWDVTPAFSSPRGNYALALDYDAGGDAVLWPEGPVGAAVGKKAKKAYQVEAVKFVNNALEANAGPVSAKDDRPLLTLTIGQTTLPTATLETPPVVDARRRVVYVFYTNAVYALDFSSSAAFSDTDVDAAGTPIKHTLFNLTHFGRVERGGATHDGGKRYVGNMTAPALDAYGTALYVLDRYPAPDAAAPTSWSYGLSKVTLPLDPAADHLVAGTPTFPSVPGEAGLSLLVDPLSKFSSGGNVYFGLGDGTLRQIER